MALEAMSDRSSSPEVIHTARTDRSDYTEDFEEHSQSDSEIRTVSEQSKSKRYINVRWLCWRR